MIDSVLFHKGIRNATVNQGAHVPTAYNNADIRLTNPLLDINGNIDAPVNDHTPDSPMLKTSSNNDCVFI